MERWRSGFAAEINGPMVAVRAVHFAATAVIAGALLFRAVVVDSAMRGEDKARLIVCNQIRRLAWIALALSVVSGALWLLLQSSAMSGQTYLEAMGSGALLTVLDNTQFGWVFEVRLALAIALAICLVCDRRPWPRWLALGAAQCLVAAIAWTGHAASTFQAWISAPHRRCAASLCRGGLDRRPGSACPIADRSQPRSHVVFDTARRSQAVFGAWHGRRRHAFGLGHHQCLDPGLDRSAHCSRQTTVGS